MDLRSVRIECGPARDEADGDRAVGMATHVYDTETGEELPARRVEFRHEAGDVPGVLVELVNPSFRYEGPATVVVRPNVAMPRAGKTALGVTAKPYLGTAREIYPIEALRELGLLWLINRVLFHPRGYALALVLDDSEKVVGFQFLGDGRDPWDFAPTDDHQGFAATRAFLEDLGRIDA
jgi:hypothetical protein